MNAVCMNVVYICMYMDTYSLQHTQCMFLHRFVRMFGGEWQDFELKRNRRKC